MVEKSMELKLVELSARYSLPRGLLARMKLEEWSNEVTDHLIYSISTHLHAIEGETIKIDVKYPENWWESFKERWFPKFVLSRLPVKYKQIRIREPRYKAVCPHLELPLPTSGNSHLIWLAEMDTMK